MKFNTIREATEEWVKEFDAIPMGVVEKLVKAADYDDDAIREITPPAMGDRVEVLDSEHRHEEGEIVGWTDTGDDKTYLVRLDDGDEEIEVDRFNLEVEREYGLPMWGTMWAFHEGLDNYWLEHGGLQKMADCGFRIYQQEDYNYIFGLDGAGYDFYESHWIPLYKARGMHWHKEDDEE